MIYTNLELSTTKYTLLHTLLSCGIFTTSLTVRATNSELFMTLLKNDIRITKSTFFCFQKQPPEVFCKKSVLRNFAKFTGKHLCQSLFFNNVTDLRPAALLKKRLWYRCFPVDFAKS